MKYVKHFMALAMASSFCATASADFVINEIDSDTPGADRKEFVELKGEPFESANGLILVFFDGADGSITFSPAVDLNGLTADENGLILIASDDFPDADVILGDGFIRNGQDAVALYQDLATNWPTGSSPTTTNLVDAIVYRATGTEANNWSGFGSVPVYDEGVMAVTSHGLSRVPDGSATIVAAEPTPDENNQTVAISSAFLPRFNQATAVVPTTETITLRNTAATPLTVTSLDLASTSSAAFSIAIAADPAPPVTLQYNQRTTITIQFLETDVSTNKSYEGAIHFTSDSPTSPTGGTYFSTELVRATTQAAVGAVKVNEICYNPGNATTGIDHNGDGDLSNQNDEFVELVNMTNAPILIEGWEQRCQDGDAPTFHSFVFPAGATIPANGFVTVFTAGNPTGFIPGTTFTYGIPRVRNAGSLVSISDGTKRIDGVAFPTAEDTPDVDGFLNSGVTVAAGGSIGRRPDGTDTFRAFLANDAILTDRPSPNATNNGDASVSDWALF